MRRKRFEVTAAVGALIVFWAVGAPSTVAGPSPYAVARPAADCTYVKDSKYWLCKALESANCSLAESVDYWLCKGLSERNCNLVESSDYWLCKGLTERNCALVGASDYWFCRGLTENCSYANRDDLLECEAFSPFFRRPVA